MEMNRERWTLIAIWAVGLAFILLFFPKSKVREAGLAFLVCQALTWIDFILHVEVH